MLICDTNTHKIYKKPSDIELPQTNIDEFARFLVPEIRKFFESVEGKRELPNGRRDNKRKKAMTTHNEKGQSGSNELDCPFFFFPPEPHRYREAAAEDAAIATIMAVCCAMMMPAMLAFLHNE